VQFSVHLIERKVIARSAVKAPKGKSALDSAPSVANSTEMANEILNEIQRDRGGDTIEEDESRYRVTVRSADGKDSWTGEVIGQPSIYPLQTVSVVTANKMLIVLDKNYKKLWQNSLTYDVQGGLSALDADNAPNGQGPCVEHKNGLFVIDEGVLTAFDLMSGNARWRFPSVGISGIFFDDKDAMYVNTTSAGIERVKYSRQIDVGRKDLDVIVKLDSRSGKVLWKTEPGGLVNYVSGKFLYTVQFYQPYEPDEDDPYSQEPASVPPYLRIKRINPRTGSVLWEHFQQRAPLDVQFDKNTIRLVFRKEVQVLRFLSL
jgi:outer membrane protein assembly factor BamB